MPFNNWPDLYYSTEQFENNVDALDIVNLLNVPSLSEGARNLQEQSDLAALIVEKHPEMSSSLTTWPR